MINENPISYLVTVIGVITGIVNCLLIYLACQVKQRTKDIKIILLIASIEMLSPIIALSDTVLSIINNDDAINKRIPCQYLGYFTMLIVFFQFVITALLAIERLSKIIKVDHSYNFIIPALLSSITHILFSLILASEYQFVPNSAKMICILSPNTSLLSSIAFYHYSISNMLCLFIIIYCYTKIAIYTNNIPKFINLESMDYGLKPSKRIWKTSSLNIRIYSILILYSVCMLGGITLIFIDGALEMNTNFDSLQFIFGSIGVSLVTSGFLFNSLLVTFTHTAISNELKLFVNRVCSRFRSDTSI